MAGDGIAENIKAQLFGGVGATETAMTERVRGLEDSHASSTIADHRCVVQNGRGQDGKTRYRMFPKVRNREVWIEAVRYATVGRIFMAALSEPSLVEAEDILVRAVVLNLVERVSTDQFFHFR